MSHTKVFEKTAIVLKYSISKSMTPYVAIDAPGRLANFVDFKNARHFASYEEADGYRKVCFETLHLKSADDLDIVELVIDYSEKIITKPAPPKLGTEVLVKYKAWEIERDRWSGPEYHARYFDLEKEARNFVTNTNAMNTERSAPEYYVQAEYVGKVEVVQFGKKYRELKD
jgi:hypothetical protein